MILAEFQKLIEFQMLNPEKLIQQIYDEDFSIRNWISGVKVKIVSKDQQQSVLDDCLVYILIAGVFLIGIILAGIGMIICKSSIRAKIKAKLVQTLDNTFFNGLIMSLKISLFKYCFSIGNQIKLAVY